MQQPKTKAEFLRMLQRERAYWEALLALVSEDDMLTPGVTGDWTFKDVVARSDSLAQAHCRSVCRRTAGGRTAAAGVAGRV